MATGIRELVTRVSAEQEADPVAIRVVVQPPKLNKICNAPVDLRWLSRIRRAVEVVTALQIWPETTNSDNQSGTRHYRYVLCHLGYEVGHFTRATTTHNQDERTLP